MDTITKDGKPHKMSSDKLWEDLFREIQMREINTDIPVYSGRYLQVSMRSGRQVIFDTYESQRELRAKMARSIVDSRNTTLTDIYGKPYTNLNDDYFNAVSYDSEKELLASGYVDKVYVGMTEKQFDMIAIMTPDIFANSIYYLKYLLENGLKGLYYHDTDLSREIDLKNQKFRKLYTGSPVPMTKYLDVSISSLDTSADRDGTQLGVVSETIPV
jgi:hypothetical protein